MVIVGNFLVEGLIDITPSNTAEIAEPYNQGLYVTGAGNVAITFRDGTSQTLTFAAGAILYARIKRVNATGTTATVKGVHLLA